MHRVSTGPPVQYSGLIPQTTGPAKYNTVSGGYLDARRRTPAYTQPVMPNVPAGSHLCVCSRAGLGPVTLGRPSVMVDTTGDGKPDAVGYDLDGDGVVDSLDTNNDGIIDAALQLVPGAGQPVRPFQDCPQRMQRPDAAQQSAPRGLQRSTTKGFSAPRRQGTQVLDMPGPSFDLDKPEEQKIVIENAKKMFQAMDIDQHGTLNKNEFMAALQRSTSLDDFVFPGIDLRDMDKKRRPVRCSHR